MASPWFGALGILFMVCSCHTYNILMISPLPARSHAILGDGIVRHLLNAGHQVTYITAMNDTIAHPNLKILHAVDNLGLINEKMLNIEAIMNNEVTMQDLSLLLHMFLESGRRAIAETNAQKMLKDTSIQFDVIIAEWMFSELYAGLQAVYDCPLIWFSTVEPHWMVLKLIDEVPNPAYSAETLSPDIPPFTFWRRVKELYNQLYGQYVQYWYISDAEQKYYEQYLVPHIRNKSKPVPSVETLRYNASLLLGNSHVSMGEAGKLPQSYKAIGGYHIDHKVKPLPKDLQDIMDNAKHGVIYFSMGSNLRSENFPKELKEGIIKFLGELKQTVIWKFGEDLPNKPKNVHIVKWAPQHSILAHPNCVLFITHGGLLSTTEAIHFGVPIVGIPVFADQFVNIERAVKKGFAKKVSLSYKMVENLRTEVTSILSDPKYATKAKDLSLAYHDRPAPPAAELVHWVEHVVKTRGAPHLRSPAIMMPWYQKLYLDLIGLIFIVVLVILYTLCRVYNEFRNKSVGAKKYN